MAKSCRQIKNTKELLMINTFVVFKRWDWYDFSWTFFLQDIDKFDHKIYIIMY